jgi:conjugal transfer pilus assembly protein TraV
MSKQSTIYASMLAASIGLSGCGALDMSGLGADKSFQCAAPEGVPCMSVTGINTNATRGTLPSMKRTAEDEARVSTVKSDDMPSLFGDGAKSGAGKGEGKLAHYGQARAPGSLSPSEMEAPYSGSPIRTAPKILRIWIAPIEDSDADLQDQRYMYVTVNTGRWLIEANQSNLVRQYKPVFQLGKQADKQEASDGDEEPKQKGPLPAGTQRLPGGAVSTQRSAGGE